ncbi:MAG: GWxTD domain-containing protein [Acidobacteria bacterium]|nr:GWxTD domain-containing protein [Acidobacteriota bacterium]
MTRPVHGPCVALVLLIALAATCPALAQPAEQGARETGDRPVIVFTRGPAMLLLEPQEILAYDGMVDLTERRAFIEKFWAGMAKNCPAGSNPNRDLFWSRVDQANGRFTDEGTAGWLTERGRVLVLLGAPESEKKMTVTTPAGPVEALVWTYPSAPGLPTSVAFVHDRLNWVFAGADKTDPGGVLAVAERETIYDPLARWAAAFRNRGCELTPEMRAEQARTLWRKVLWDTAEKVHAGEAVKPARPVEPRWYFFPAEGDMTLSWLVLGLDQQPPEGARLVGMLRPPEGDMGYAFGGDIPFEVRKSGSKWVAQSARAVPPGKYAAVVGMTTADGGTEVLSAAEQLVVRMPLDVFRLSSAVLVQDVRQLAEGDDPHGPFRISGYEIVPRATRTVTKGEQVRVFYEVLGAGEATSGGNDFDVSYGFAFRPNAQAPWKKNNPNVSKHQSGAARVWEFQVPAWPQGEYRLEIQVTDNVSGQKASAEVPFEIR